MSLLPAASQTGERTPKAPAQPPPGGARGGSTMGRPVPTARTAVLLALGLVPAVASGAQPALVWVAVAWDALVLVAAVLDAVLAPRRAGVEVTRQVEDVVSAGVPNRVGLEVVNLGRRRLSLELADDPPLEARVDARRFPVRLAPLSRAALRYHLLPLRRGDHAFGDLHLRLVGPLGLAAVQHRVAAARTVKAYPDLAALARDAVALARPVEESALVKARRSLGEGREFESLRPYVTGDDYRAIDWKASARRGSLVARSYEPERNQTVVIVVDCGRNMTARLAGRVHLDHVVDAVLRLSRVCLDRGDNVGLAGVAARLTATVTPAKGRAQLHRLVEALYHLQPELEEPDWAAAFDWIDRKVKRRALVVTFTDLTDEDSSRELVARVARLRPRHLPLVVSCDDADLAAAALRIPAAAEQAYERAAAQRLLHERQAARTRLSALGARVVAARADALSAAAINEYLDVKGRGLL